MQTELVEAKTEHFSLFINKTKSPGKWEPITKYFQTGFVWFIHYATLGEDPKNLGEDPKNVLNITDFFFYFVYVSSNVPYTNLCKGKFTVYKIKKGPSYINLE